MDSLRNVSEWEERLERVAHGSVNALVGHVFPLFQMVEGSGAPGAGNDPVQPRMDDQGVASRMDAVYPEGRAEGVRFHGSVAAGDVSGVGNRHLRQQVLAPADGDLLLPGDAGGDAPVLHGAVLVPGGAGTGTLPEGTLGAVQEFNACEGFQHIRAAQADVPGSLQAEAVHVIVPGGGGGSAAQRAVRIVVHAAVGEVAVNVHAVSTEQVAVVTLVEGQHQAVLVCLELLVRGVEGTEGLAEGRAGYPVFRPGVVHAHGIAAALVVKAGGSRGGGDVHEVPQPGEPDVARSRSAEIQLGSRRMGEAVHHPDGGPQRVGDAGGFLSAQGLHGVDVDLAAENQVQAVVGNREAGIRDQVRAALQRGVDAGEVPQGSVRINDRIGVQVDQGEGEALFLAEKQVVSNDHIDVRSIHMVGGRDVHLGIGVRSGMGGVRRRRSVHDEREFLHSPPRVQAAFIVVVACGGAGADHDFTAVIGNLSLEGAGTGDGRTAVGFHAG